MNKKITQNLKTICFLAICFGVISASNAQRVTTVLADIFNGTSGGSPSPGRTNQFVRVGNKIIFSASDGTTTSNLSWMHGLECFVLDLSQPVTTNGGTSAIPWSLSTNPQLIDLRPNTTTVQGSSPTEYVAVGNKVYFVAGTALYGTNELYELDLSKSLSLNSDSVNTNNTKSLYNATTNPRLIDIIPGATAGTPANLVVYGSKLYFHATTTATGNEMFVLNTKATIADNGSGGWNASTNPSIMNVGVDNPSVFSGIATTAGTQAPIGLGGKLYFAAASVDSVGYELWAYDTASTIGSGNPAMVANVNYNICRSASAGNNRASQSGAGILFPTVVGSKLFYLSSGADTATFVSGSNLELWVYDPSQSASTFTSSTDVLTSNPHLVKDINSNAKSTPNGYSGAGINTAQVFSFSGSNPYPYRIPQINGVVYFQGYNGAGGNGNELWRSDGTSGGTYMVKDLAYTISNTSTAGPVLMNTPGDGKLYFSAFYGTGGTGGSPQGCFFVYNPAVDTTQSMTLSSSTNPQLVINSGSSVSNQVVNKTIASINGLVYFQNQIMSAATYGTELVVFDPTKSVSTTWDTSAISNPRIIDMFSGSSNGNATSFTDYNGTLLMAAQNGSKGVEVMGMNIYNAITASAGTHGTVTNTGTTNVNWGYNSPTYTITPDCGYAIDSLIVDGVKVTSTTTKSFTAVSAAHTIRATFIAMVPTITISTASTTVCSGDAVPFTSSIADGGASPSYVWYKNGVNVGSGSSIAFAKNTLTTGDMISCVLTNTDCLAQTTGSSNTVQLTVKQSPSIGVSTITLPTLCTIGATTTAYNSNTSGGGVWTSSNTSVATVTTSAGASGNVTSTGVGTSILTYTKTANNGCAVSASATLSVSTTSSAGSISGTNSVCPGSTTTLSSTVAGGTWSSPSSSIASVNPSTGVVTGNSVGTAAIVYKISSGACNSAASYNVTVNAKPNVPTIQYAVGTSNPQTGTGGAFCVGKSFTLVGGPATSASGTGVWSSSNNSVMTVNASTGLVNIVAVGSASLTYTYTSTAGCGNSRSISGTAVTTCFARGMNTTSNEQLVSNNEFTMYPNPAKSFVGLQVGKLVGAGSIVITDLYGKQVKTQVLSMGNNTLDIANLSKGFYLVSIITSEGKNTKKLIVE